MPRNIDPEAGFLEEMLNLLPGEGNNDILGRWLGDPIRNHLSLLFNARQGSVEHLPDYGMPDMSSYYSDYPASLTGLRAAVEALIRKYEPRLSNPRVRLIGSDNAEFKVSMVITGEIEEGDGSTNVTYRTTIFHDGKTELSD